MNIQIISDTHLEVSHKEITINPLCDLVILAGDIGDKDSALTFIKGINKPVIYVLGNHEYWGNTIKETKIRIA